MDFRSTDEECSLQWLTGIEVQPGRGAVLRKRLPGGGLCAV